MTLQARARRNRPPAVSHKWRFAASDGALLALFGSVWTVYGTVLQKLVHDWRTDADGSHGLICAAAAVTLAVSRRRALRAVTVAPHPAGLLIVSGSLLVFLLGRIGAELFLTRVSLLGTIAGTVVFVLGWSQLRLLALPLAVLLLSIPIPAVLVSQVTLPMQLLASSVAETILQLARIPVFRDGNVMVLPNTTLQVAEACSGIRSLAALVALALFFAWTAERRVWARALIVFATVPAALLMNALRVAGTAAGSYRFGPALAHGMTHELLGFVTFALALALVVAAGRALGAGWSTAPGVDA